MTRRLSMLGLFGGVVMISGCATHVVVTPNLPSPDSITQPALASLMRSVANPTIVLRVPAWQDQVAQAQAQAQALLGQMLGVPAGQGQAQQVQKLMMEMIGASSAPGQLPQAQTQVSQQGGIPRTFNLIEKELVKAGFTVRDRGLLEQVIRSTPNLDYRIIQNKIDAQLILEIVAISPRSYETAQYAHADGGATGKLTKGTFPIWGWQVECKIILVSTGEVGGIYTIDVAPGTSHFVLDPTLTTFTNADEQGRPDKEHLGYGIPPEGTAKPFVEKLIAHLKSAVR
jgi:hypothetical protein